MPKKPKPVRRLRRNSKITYNSRVYIYLSDDEKQKLQAAADAQGISMSAYIANASIQRAKTDLVDEPKK